MCKNEYKIRLTEDAEPIRTRCRRIPRSQLEKIKTELKRMEDQCIIQSVRECIDPRPLKKFIKRTNIHMPTIEQILDNIVELKYHTVLDAKSAFHQIPLDQETSKVCTIVTPFGR